MKDLIFKLNLKESTFQYCLVETYMGELKFLKKRMFSGPLKPVNILQLDSAQNLPSKILKGVKNILYDESRQSKKNKYLLSLPSLNRLLSLLDGIRGIYCTSFGRGLYELDGMDTANLKFANGNTLNSHRGIYLDVSNGNKIYLDNKSYCCNICGVTIVFAKNRLYIINQSVDLSMLKKFITLKQSKLAEFDIQSILTKESVNSTNEITSISPIPVLYVAFADASISGSLFFSYNGYEIPSNASKEKLRDDFNRVIYLRSLLDEKRALSQMTTAGWMQTTSNEFVLKRNSYTGRSLLELLRNNFEILTYDHKNIQPSINADFNISYGVNWFELNASYKKNDNTIDLTHLIDLKSRKRYIELGNEIILLPDTIWENRNIFEKNGNKIAIAKKYISQISEILDQGEVSSTFNIVEIVDYKNINLSLPTQLNKTLRPYQKEGIQWLLHLYKNKLGGCLADDMGLGKTIQVIAFIVSLYMSECRHLRILVVVPKTLIESWKGEFRKFGEHISVNTYHGAKRENALKEFERGGGVLLTTYNILLNDIKVLNVLSFHCMFIDEAQYIKNFRAKTYAAVKKIKVQSKYILSGTPFENNINELWALMDLINPGCLGNRTVFLKKYGNITSDKITLKRLNARIKPFVLRRMKKDVLKELPEKTEVNLICDMSDKQRELYEGLLISIKSEIERMPNRFEIKDASIILEGLLYLRQVCCHPALLKKSLNWNHCDESSKFELFKLKIDELMENNEKVVVFSQFTSMLGIMRNWADKQGYAIYYLDGSTKNRQELVGSFENAKEGIFFISLKAGGVGLNIVSCQYSIIYDPWWNPALENQAADRIYRIGQTKNVFIYHLVTANSIEEKIEELKIRKKEIAENILFDTGASAKLSIEKLKELIYD